MIELAIIPVSNAAMGALNKALDEYKWYVRVQPLVAFAIGALCGLLPWPDFAALPMWERLVRGAMLGGTAMGLYATNKHTIQGDDVRLERMTLR